MILRLAALVVAFAAGCDSQTPVPEQLSTEVTHVETARDRAMVAGERLVRNHYGAAASGLWFEQWGFDGIGGRRVWITDNGVRYGQLTYSFLDPARELVSIRVREGNQWNRVDLTYDDPIFDRVAARLNQIADSLDAEVKAKLDAFLTNDPTEG